MNRLVSIAVPILVLLLLTLSVKNLAKFKPEISIEMCDNFEYPETRIICYSFFLKKPDYCKLVDNFRVECYYFSLIGNLSEEACNEVKEPIRKAKCISALAMKNKDPRLCEKNIAEQTLLEYCLANIPPSYYNLYSEAYCNNLTHESARYTCLAIVKKNESFCKRIITEPWEQNSCLAILSKNTNYCLSDLCYKQMAFVEKNANLCKFIGARWDKAECIGRVSKDVNRCGELNGKIARDLCKLYALESKKLD